MNKVISKCYLHYNLSTKDKIRHKGKGCFSVLTLTEDALKRL